MFNRAHKTDLIATVNHFNAIIGYALGTINMEPHIQFFV